MAYPMECVAKAILVMASSSTILIYGPILGTAVLITALLFARAATDSKARNTTRRKPRKRSGSPKWEPSFGKRAIRFQGPSAADGKRKCLARL
jgi:H+/gluconate symporter-like permease